MATTHRPYAALPTDDVPVAPAATVAPTGADPTKKRSPPAISRPSVSHTMAVLREVQAVGAAYFAVPRLGWRVLQRLWQVTPADFDAVALAHLALQPEALQQHVLLMLATTGVRKVQNLSAFLSCLIHDVCQQTPVCLGFIAGCCGQDSRCPFTHPRMVTAWATLQQRWQIGWLDFDYLVLNSLLLKPAAKQDQLLRSLARMKLKNVRNPSALLASLVGQSDAASAPPPWAARRTGRPRRRKAGTVPGEATPGEVTPGEAAGPRAPAPERSPSAEPGSLAATLEDGVRCLALGGPLEDPQGSSPGWRSLEAEDFTADTPLAPPPAAPSPQDRPSSSSEPTAPRPPLTAAALPPQPKGPSPDPLTSAAGLTEPDMGAPSPLTARVVELLREGAALTPPAAGWGALRGLWGVGPADLEPTALDRLQCQPPLRQEHTLLSLAAMDLCQPHHDLSTLLHAASTAPYTLCWRHLAGLCPAPATCPCGFRHPGWGPAWAWLRQWGVSYLDIEYAVLNVLLQLPPPLQDRILAELCHRLPYAARHPSQQLVAIMKQVLWKPR
eukprot:EG_transcript_8263